MCICVCECEYHKWMSKGVNEYVNAKRNGQQLKDAEHKKRASNEKSIKLKKIFIKYVCII